MSTKPAEALQGLRQAFADSAPADPVLRKQRERALERFMMHGFPGTREEAWRYTNLRNLTRRVFVTAGDGAISSDQLNACRIPDLQGHLLVFLDGRLQHQLSDQNLPAGLRLSHLEAQDSEDSGQTLPAFSNLNTAFNQDARLLQIDANTSVEKPLYLLFVSGQNEQPTMLHPRLEISAGTNSRINLVEHHLSLAQDENLVNSLIDINLAAGARMNHTRIQDASKKSFQICRVNVDQARDSHYTHDHICLGSALARMDIHVSLSEPGAEVELHGLMLGQGRQHMDTHTQVDHIAPLTQSRETYRCVLDGKSRGVFNGKVVVHRDAQKIEAHQASNNLLLSDQAEIDTKPELEIYADDVKCSHGATVGQLDKNALFYLLSRGIERTMARSLLVFAFADEIVAGIGEPSIRHAMEKRIVSQLPDGDRLREFV
ncbi:MAG: Fe-S cluster assembly protein SufD [Gammaproteobacteria bacterium]|nr:Fe-S cluster assembly protein SufD [Gammaproteobacteria bacterium]